MHCRRNGVANRLRRIPKDAKVVDPDLIGYTRPERYIAAFIDAFASVLFMICVAVVLSEAVQVGEDTVANAIVGCSLGLLYFAYFLTFEVCWR